MALLTDFSRSVGLKESIFRGFFLSASNAMCIFNRNGISVEYNNPFRILFQLSEGEPVMIGQLVEKLHCISKNAGKKDCWNKVINSLQNREPFPGSFEIFMDEEGSLCMNITFSNFDDYILLSFFDITENKKTQELLSKEKEFSQAVLDNMEDGVVACDQDGILALFNNKARQWHGLDPIATASDDWASSFDLFNEDGISPLEAKDIPLSRAFSGEQVRNAPFTIKSDDYLRNIIGNGGPFFDKENKKIGALIVMRDITEALKKEKELLGRGELLKKMISTLPDAVVETDMTGTIRFANEQITNLGYNRPASELPGTTIFSFIAPEDQLRASEDFKMLLERNPGAIEYHVIVEPGNDLICEVSGNVLRDADLVPYGMIFIVRNVTERKKALEQIRLLAHTIKSVSEVVVITDINNRIIFINEAFLSLFGYTEEELTGKSFDIVNSDKNDPELSRKIYQETLKGGWKGCLWNMCKDGSEIYLDLSTSTLKDEYGNIQYIVGVGRDITKQAEAERLMKEQDEMLRLTGRMAKVGGWDYDVRTGKGKWTDEVARIHDIETDSEPDIRMVLDCYPEDQAGILFNAARNSISGSGQYDVELEMVSAKGVKKCVRVIGYPVVENAEIVSVKGMIQDITVQKRSEEELIRSRKEFKDYFDNSTIGVCITSPEKGWIEVNDRICEMLGYSKEELYKLTWVDLTHPDDLSKDMTLFEKVIRGEIENYELDKRFIRKDGSVVYTTIFIVGVRNADGSLNHVIGSLVNITSRIIAEEKIRISEKKFREIAYLLPVAIFEADMQGTLTFINQAGKEWFGYSDSEIAKGINVIDVINDDERNEAIKKFQKIIRQNIISSGEYHLLPKNGVPFHALITSMAIEQDGSILGIRGVINDISDRIMAKELHLKNEAAEARIKAQRHLSLLVDQSLVGFIELNTKLEIVAWNPSAERIFGFNADEAIGKKITQLIIPSADKKRVKNNLDEVLNNRFGFKNINKNITKDGRIITCEWHDTALVDTDGQIISIVSLVADITERVEAEEGLKKSGEKLKRFAAHLQQAIEEERIQISRDLHDSLGQSLTGLKMYASRLYKYINENERPEKTHLSGDVREMIDVIDSEMVLIRKIARRLRPRILDEMGLIPAMESQLEEFRSQSGISFTIDNPLPRIRMEAKYRIEVFRIFQEVLTNIIRHSKASAISVSMSEEHHTTRIVIQDNGIGIGEIDIWEMKTLGLLGMQERAAVFGGSLEISSKPGSGTKVVIGIPFYKKTT